MTTHTPNSAAKDDVMASALNDILAIQLKATAALQLQMAAALTGKGQDELREHFCDSATLMMKAQRALTARVPA